MGWRLRAGATAVTVVALLGGYLVADAHDVVPGMLTLAPAPPAPAPFPTPPGAMLGPEPAPILRTLPDDAPVPSASDVGALVADLAGDARLGPHVGALVVDAATGDTLGAADANAGFTPASTQKVLTAVAALQELGPDRTLDTKAVLDGDRLVLVGGGDMLLAAGAGDPDAVNGRAGLGDLAAQAAARITVSGKTQVRLAVEDTLFTGPAVAPAVPEDEVTLGFVAPVASLAVNVAMLGEGSWGPRAPDPALAAAQAFAQELATRGVTVTGSIVRASEPSRGRVVGQVSSASIGEISGWAMQYSDNTITEVLGRLVAIETGRPGSNEGATQAVRSVVESLGVDLAGAVLVDCSGLGRGSRLTPRQLADTLRLTTDPAHPHLRDAAVDLAVGALSGTLASRFGGENPARGLVRAKTGSLPGVVGLAGMVVTADDRLLVFALQADQIESGATVGARMIFDAFVGRLATLRA
ncbi:D-alanyl-D-alanine carboxypeptidase/D-alanyl-D-alanine endopeptidase [Xylanimonas ulmi]|uniref:D-alanyl-D-alanine carboxypeptidase/D-alanyl-D-alanine-endopeptidase (Penicillin-binding protein 4) n=1 Tax=Xylanimonas ulmi TaxID=228973 RepID=A0A4Q7M6B1_9MICO|nr:D-alanyl-D-alanine carboxypeptidase/D-alanyl-D-alanine-endopeptidase [Xylanibacterium ulmi]RZS62138.1 D-alanyl-D-alanine carboxypeptidase/D-alanyl-D-alanine-endopeptidase (penicillin-binding protein 4) [Xylanibacterium ulmi]